MTSALPIEERYRRALLWIRHTAGLHYFGGAFEPEHMRDLANIAADALDLRWGAGTHGRLRKDLPDYEAAMERAMARGREMAAKLGFDLADDATREDDE